ncbi:YybH family protein [Nonomuraea sp. NPDC050394]|uniref:YybH family protein n=1 Tax=Nonomuraea sp. NPDC050394 TaxID=3364363 RepID=UPI0037BA4D7C
MKTDEQRIRTLIENWAEAVHRGDLEGVLADHAEDIVMYDVPPPNQGVRGIDAYRETWPPFFEWQASGAVFEIESLEVTAGDDVAFAHALLRCGTVREFAEDPGNRLRLTIGLRKEEGRWVVTHEHHSFPLTVPAGAEREIRELHETWSRQTAAGDLDGMMATIAGDVVSYEHETPLEYRGVEAVREVCARGLDTPGVTLDNPGLTVLTRDDLAVAWCVNVVRGEGFETWSRATRIFRRAGGRWLMVHQHLSYPRDPETGQARTDLRPRA